LLLLLLCCCCFQRIFHGFNLQRYRRYYVYFPIIPLCLQLYLEFHLFSTSRQFVWFSFKRQGGRGVAFLFFYAVALVFSELLTTMCWLFIKLVSLSEPKIHRSFRFFHLFTRAAHTDTHTHTYATEVFKQIRNPWGFFRIFRICAVC